ADLLDVFFFQAEDGIRAFRVTGVQTCALPILCYADGSDGFPLDWWYGLPEDAYIDEVEPTLSDAELLARIRRVAGVLTPDAMPEIGRAAWREIVEVWGGEGEDAEHGRPYTCDG